MLHVFLFLLFKKRAQLKDMKKDDTNQVNRKLRKSNKKKDNDVNVLVREANIEAESVITSLREETAQWTCEKYRIRPDTLRRVGGGPISVSTQALLPDV